MAMGTALISLFLISSLSLCQGISDPSNWYTRYDHYPPYCSTSMEGREVPPLVTNQKVKLLHVSAIIRHGARTPWMAHENCWKGYLDPQADTAKWDCTLTTLTAPPTPQGIQRDEAISNNYTDVEPMFLFEKHYTALHNPSVGLNNDLGGTCQVGQLLLQGYEQELANGKHLRSAYVLSGEADETTIGGGLLQVDEPLWTEKGQIHLRADDDQRTLMSGQVVLRGMLGPELEAHTKEHGEYPIIPLKTADRWKDILDANEKVCPRLKDIRFDFVASKEYQDFSADSKELRNFMRNVLGLDEGVDMNAIDCIMTTLCTDRTLPDAINDYSPEQVGMLERLYEWQVKNHTMVYSANDAIYAKLAMQPLFSEIMTIIRVVVDTTMTEDAFNLPNDADWSKLALYSGHDTTIMPLLATLGPNVWDKKWAPYASMLLVEVYGVLDETDHISGHAFRLVYNGEVITSRMEQCSSDVCNLDELLEQTNGFSHVEDWNCESNRQPDSPASNSADSIGSNSSEFGGTALLLRGLVLCVMSAVVGSLLTVMVLKRRGLLGSRVAVPTEPGDLHLTSIGSQEDERNVIINRIRGMAGKPGDNGGEVLPMKDMSSNGRIS